MDLDREVAIRKGFKPHNLIAIDHDSEIVKKLRKEGKLAIDAKLKGVVDNWSGDGVDVLYADLCGGATFENVAIAATMTALGGFEKTVMAFNLMRGRDRWVAKDKCEAEETKKEYEELVMGRHRGKAIFEASKKFVKYHFRNGIEENAKSEELKSEESLTGLENIIEMVAEKECMPISLSYMSTSGQVFDSQIWKNISVHKIWNFIANLMGKEKFLEFEKAVATDPRNKIARKVVAIRAVRTMRMTA